MDRENGRWFSPLVLLVLVATAVGVFSPNPPLVSEREVDTANLVPSQGRLQNIPLRLWMDPLSVLKPKGSEGKKAEPSGPGPATLSGEAGTLRELLNALDLQAPIVHVVPVIITGRNYQDDVETRLRIRYAVVSALNDYGFHPRDPDNLGVVRFEQENTDICMPFEIYGETNEAPNRVMVLLWIGDQEIGATPLSSVNGILEAVQSKPDRDVAVIGHISSTMLLEFLRDPAASATNSGRTVPCFLSLATMDEERFHPPLPKSGVLGKLLLARTITPDSLLAELLIAELCRRGVTPGLPDSPVALVGELDTAYGRALMDIFSKVLCCKCDSGSLGGVPAVGNADSIPGGPKEAWMKRGVYRFCYFRGIDAGQDSRESNSTDVRQASETSTRHRAFGKVQMDYLERFAESLEVPHLVDAPRVELPDRDFRAIGILGSDVYDKLLILAALRPRFPNALFFTTDLDAEFLGNAHFEHTRNLLIASPYTLSPPESVPRGSDPPEAGPAAPIWFRDSYQTSAYVATIAAVKALRAPTPAAPQNLVGQASPSVLEVSRSGFYQYRNELRNPRCYIVGIALSLVVGVFLTCRVVFRIRRDPSASSDADSVTDLPESIVNDRRCFAAQGRYEYLARRTWQLGCVAFSFLVALLWFGACFTQEPVEWSLHISTWANTTAYLAAAVWAVTSIVYAFITLRGNASQIAWSPYLREQRDGLFASRSFASVEGGETCPRPRVTDEARKRGQRPWRRPCYLGDVYPHAERYTRDPVLGKGAETPGLSEEERHLVDLATLEPRGWYWRFLPGRMAVVARKWADDRSDRVRLGQCYWRYYVERHSIANQCTRLAGWLILAAVLYVALLLVIGPLPAGTYPARSQLGRILLLAMHQVATFATCVLLLYVLDITRLCDHFVQPIARAAFPWYEPNSESGRDGTEEQVSAELIGRRTVVVQRSLYLPAFAILLLCFARNGVGVHLGWSAPETIICLFLSATNLWSMVDLKGTVENARHDMLESLQDKLLREYAAQRETNDDRIKGLEEAIRSIQATRKGAFGSWLASPALASPLLPIGGMGLAQFVQWAWPYLTSFLG